VNRKRCDEGDELFYVGYARVNSSVISLALKVHRVLAVLVYLQRHRAVSLRQHGFLIITMSYAKPLVRSHDGRDICDNLRRGRQPSESVYTARLSITRERVYIQ